MSQPHSEIQPDTQDPLKLEQSVMALGQLYGIKNLSVVVMPGAGWACAKHGQGLTIIVDPQQTVEGNSKYQRQSSEQEAVTPEITTLFIAAHELGHARDFLDPEWHPPATADKSLRFFNMLIDDTVIDTRSRQVPLLNTHADQIYGYQMPSDLTTMPRHVQLLYGLRVGTVTGKPVSKIDPQVAAAIESITHYVKGGREFNIMTVLADPRTTYAQRRRIADEFILPHYQELLVEDRQGDEPGDGNENGNDEFDKDYTQYEQAAHGHRSEHQLEQPAENTPSQLPQDKSTLPKQASKAGSAETKDDQQQPTTAVRLMGGSGANAGGDSNDKNTSDLEKIDLNDEQNQVLVEAIIKEMGLDASEADSYAQSLNRLSATISGVADVFLKLAAPTDEFMSPRYDESPSTQGVRLHPRTIARVALQLASGQEQPIWQPVERRAARQGFAFGGLDIHLLVDVSSSMAGSRGVCAGDAALCLMEGLQLARYKASRMPGMNRQPDVRTQIISFGSDTAVLSPLSYEPTGIQKGKVFSDLRNPHGGSTFVAQSLRQVRESAEANPERSTLVIIISDGAFSDRASAKNVVQLLSQSTYVSQLIIGNQDFVDHDDGEDTLNAFIINDNYAFLDDPQILHLKLYDILKVYILKHVK